MRKRKNIARSLRDHWIRDWEEHDREGRYQPFLRTEDVSSSGNRGRVCGHTTGRIHHLMSHAEMLQFMRLDYHPRIVEIQEQYPLLPVQKTRAIASELGFKHPLYPGSSTPIVMTSDFLFEDEDGVRHAIAVKAAGAMSTRTRQKLYIEEAYWKLQNVEWHLALDTSLRTQENENLIRLHPFGALREDLLLLESDWLKAFSTEVRRSPHERAAEVIERSALRLGTDFSDAAELFYHAIWRQAVQVDLTVPLHLELSISELGVRIHD